MAENQTNEISDRVENENPPTNLPAHSTETEHLSIPQVQFVSSHNHLHYPSVVSTPHTQRFAVPEQPNSALVRYIPVQALPNSLNTDGRRRSYPIYVPQSQKQNVSSEIDTVDPASERSRGTHPIIRGRGRGGRGRSTRSGTLPSSRKLSDGDLRVIIEYWKQNYDTWCKSNKKAFSKKAAEYLNRTYFSTQTVDKTKATPEQLERKFSYWVSRYKEVADKFMQSGFGLTESDPTTLRETAEKKLKYFFELHSFLSGRSNITPAVVLQTKRNGDKNKLAVDQDYGDIHFSPHVSEKPPTAGDKDAIQMSDESSESGRAQPSQIIGRKRKSLTDTVDELEKKRRRASGAVIINNEDDDNIVPDGTLGGQGGSRSNVREGETQSVGEKEGRTPSSARVRMLKDIYQNQVSNKNSQQQYIDQNTSYMQSEAKFREKELSIMEKSTEVQLEESEFLRFERKRLEREEQRLEEEEARKKREDRRKEEDNLRKKLTGDEKCLLTEQHSFEASFKCIKELIRAIRSIHAWRVWRK